MRIESKQIVAGFPAVQIRRLMRETVGRSISPRCVREVLQCSESDTPRKAGGLMSWAASKAVGL